MAKDAHFHYNKWVNFIRKTLGVVENMDAVLRRFTFQSLYKY